MLKEFYPRGIAGITRVQSTIEVPDGSRMAFETRQEQFQQGISQYIKYYEAYDLQSNPRPFFFGKANGTVYSVSDPSTGIILTDIERKNLTLYRISNIMSSLCDTIARFHDQELLYLDCKPDNIFFYTYDRLDDHVRLFDFDTVVPIKEIQAHPELLSYTKRWAPEEVVNCWTDKIGKESDIFSIGAVFFWLLTGRNPAERATDKSDIGNGRFRWESIPVLKRSSKEVLALVRRIGERTLLSAESRYHDISRLKQDFTDLAALTEGSVKTHRPIYAVLSDLRAAEVSSKEGIDALSAQFSEKEGREKIRNKRIMIAVVTLALVAVIGITAGLIFGHRAVNTIISATSINYEINDHMLLELSNANHQYEMGIENYRRLDYVRADSDIRAARDEISEHQSQSALDVARVNNSLGCLYLDMGRYNEAYDYLNSAYVTFRDQLGESSIEARAVRASIAQYYFNTGRLDEALTETQYILDHSDADKEKAIIAGTSHLRALVFDAQGKYDESLNLYQQVLDMYSDISQNGKMSEQLANYANDPKLSQGEKDYYTNAVKWIILTYNNIAKVSFHRGDTEAAITAANAGIDLSLSNIYIGRRNLTTSKLYMNRAVAEERSGDLSSALDDIDLAMRIQRNLFDFEDVFPGLVEVYDIYGELLESKQDYEGALNYYESAVSLALDSFGENHPNTASALYTIGTYYYRSGDITVAIDYMERAIEIRRNILAEDHPDTAQMYYALAIAQVAAGDKSAARESLLHAQEICDKWGIESGLRDEVSAVLKNM